MKQQKRFKRRATYVLTGRAGSTSELIYLAKFKVGKYVFYVFRDSPPAKARLLLAVKWR